MQNRRDRVRYEVAFQDFKPRAMMQKGKESVRYEMSHFMPKRETGSGLKKTSPSMETSIKAKMKMPVVARVRTKVFFHRASTTATATMHKRIRGFPGEDCDMKGLRLKKTHVEVSQNMYGAKTAKATAAAISGKRMRVLTSERT